MAKILPMNNVLFLHLLILLSAFGYASPPKNIVVFLVDDLGWRDLSHTGSALYETPNVDRLASEGMRFTNAYTAHPRCVPARWALMTGKFPARGGVPGRSYDLEPEEFTFAEALQEAGYRTFFAGKWHLSKQPEQMPDAQGFDINVGGGAAGAPASFFWPYNTSRVAGHKTKAPIEIEGGSEGTYLNDHLTDATLDFLREHQAAHPEQPFLVYLSHYAVHTPLEAPEELTEPYRTKLASMNFPEPAFIDVDGTTKQYQDDPVYAAMVESMDRSLGRVLNELESLGLSEDTVVIFTSDHGGLSNRGINNQRRLATSNLPLRAGKGHLYEGGIKVPFLVRWPGVTTSGSVSDFVTVGTDVYPTALQAAGLPLLPEQHLDGVGLRDVLEGSVLKREDPVFWHSPRGRPKSTGDRNASAVRVGDWKLVDYFDEQHLELFDLSTDPNETTNLVETEPGKTVELKRFLDTWKTSIDAVPGK